MNLKEIKDIINLMNENDLDEIEIEREGTKIKLKKSTADIPGAPARHPPAYYAETPPSLPHPVLSETPANPPSNRKEIKSPMVGTFYRSPSPEAALFVEIGQTVEVGQVVCIVEAMKLMNEIKSEVRGKIVEILVENAQPVEFGQVLFVVEPL